MIDKQRKLRILIIGGAGFVGSHLCAALSSKSEYQITSFDNYSSGSAENHVEGVTYIRGDTRSINEMLLPQFNVIYHLGEYSRVENSLDHIDSVIDNNVVGLSKVLTFCAKNEAKLIYAGSSTKFGDNGRSVHETPYALTKSINTDLVQSYCRWRNLEYCISYFYNVYGPRENKEGQFATVIGIFQRKLENAEALPVVLPGTQRRNFTHVEDIVSGLILLLDAESGDHYGIGAQED